MQLCLSHWRDCYQGQAEVVQTDVQRESHAEAKDRHLRARRELKGVCLLLGQRMSADATHSLPVFSCFTS